MTYTINQNVDVNAQVDIGDLNIQGHTISNSQNGTIVITTGSESHLDITYATHISNLVLSGNDIGTKSSNANLTFTPHGSGIVKSNAAFEVGNINLTDNTISSTNTNGDILLSPNGTGNVGIGTTNPTAKLDIGGDTDGQVQAILTRGFDTDFQLQAINESSSNNSGDIVSKFGLRHGTNETALFNFIRGNLSNDGSLAIVTNNTERMRVDSGGNVGIGTSNPGTKLQVDGYQTFYDYDLLPGFNSSGAKVSSKIILGNEYCPQIRVYYPDQSFTDQTDLEFWTGGQNVVTDNTSSRLTIKAQSGNVGIGTSSPYAKLHVNGAGSGLGLNSGEYRRFDYSSSGLVASSGGWTASELSIWALNNIVSRQSIASHSNATFSDERIKKNIIDINDGEALDVIRQIQPKKYEYKDVVMKGTKPVWGFIAQQIASVLDYSTEFLEKEIPNIYSNATIQGKTLTFESYDTSNLVTDNEGNICKKLFLMSEKDTEVTVTIDTIINSNSITILEDIEKENMFENIIFVYGQYVKDFHVLKKDAIFTVAVAALQEVDRRQTSDNERILELEGDLSEAQETIITQDQRIVVLEAQVAALMQHTGVTI